MTQHPKPDLPEADAQEAANHLGQDNPEHSPDGSEHSRDRAPAAGTIRKPGGLATGLQSGGTIPGKSPGATVGSIGTGGGSTAGAPTGTAKRGV